MSEDADRLLSNKYYPWTFRLQVQYAEVCCFLAGLQCCAHALYIPHQWNLDTSFLEHQVLLSSARRAVA